MDLEDLQAAALSYPSVRMTEAQPNDLLNSLAQNYANWMAENRRQGGHEGWNSRFHRIAKELSMTGSEITAESWLEQHSAEPIALWEEMLKSWQHSLGHWKTCIAPHVAIGASMARGHNGVWYGCVIVAD